MFILLYILNREQNGANSTASRRGSGAGEPRPPRSLSRSSTIRAPPTQKNSAKSNVGTLSILPAYWTIIASRNNRPLRNFLVSGVEHKNYNGLPPSNNNFSIIKWSCHQKREWRQGIHNFHWLKVSIFVLSMNEKMYVVLIISLVLEIPYQIKLIQWGAREAT